MRKVTISVQVEAEKLRAIQFYVGKKDSSLEAELDDCITKIYEKYVPAQTREYIESMGGAERKPKTSRSSTEKDASGGDSDEQ